jgi:small-conductance mechanosensitive channel
VSIILHVFLSPTIPAFRIPPLQDDAARKMYRFLIGSLGYIFTVLIFSVVIQRLGATLHTVLLLQLFFATLLLGAALVTILVYKDQVRKYLTENIESKKNTAGWGRKQFASVWHILGVLYIAILWILLVNDIATPDPNQKTRGAFLLSFFIVPLWMTADQLIQWVVRYAVVTLNIYNIDDDPDEKLDKEGLTARENDRQFYLKIKQFARTAVLASLLIWVASLWDIKILFLSNLTAVLLNGIIVMALALLLWRFISSWIEKKIQESIPEDEEESSGDSEFGNAPARGRSYTLLPMVRKFIGSILIVMVTMTILSSMGVDIGPLLAGAGVIGLAVGFGAQKLVADIFSGFFFLLDDAFRVGEYLTAGSVSGTVETITLRNVMLRHHRGMLQIVPHSELGAITNYMRGGMVVKFNLDFPYDANIDQIRKVIKKVGQAMLKDEELGKDFIHPVKSQGVYQITNSVMTIRVKFTAKPGTHFVIRREAYKRITEALAAKGIYYAHKKVIVDVPGLQNTNGSSTLSDDQIKAVAEGAGAAAVLQEEEEQAARRAGTK